MIDNLLKLFKFKPDETVYTIHRKSMNSKYIPKRVYINYVSIDVAKCYFANGYEVEINYNVMQVSGDRYSNKHLYSELFATKKEAQDECNKRNDEEKKNKKQYKVIKF